MPKLAVVTGAGSGIGRSLALRMADAGTEVLAVGRREAQLAETARLAPSGRVRTCAADLGAPEGRAKVKAAVGDSAVHILVHCAGAIVIGSLSASKPEAFQMMARVNLEAPIFLTQALLPNLQAAGGAARILIVSSGAGDAHIPTMGGYCVTKAGVKMVWKALRDELAEVAAVGYCLPGLVKTEMLDGKVGSDNFAIESCELNCIDGWTDVISGRIEGGDVHTPDEVAVWIAALLDGARCDDAIFREREHNMDVESHQFGLDIRKTTEAQRIEEAAQQQSKS